MPKCAVEMDQSSFFPLISASFLTNELQFQRTTRVSDIVKCFQDWSQDGSSSDIADTSGTRIGEYSLLMIVGESASLFLREDLGVSFRCGDNSDSTHHLLNSGSVVEGGIVDV